MTLRILLSRLMIPALTLFLCAEGWSDEFFLASGKKLNSAQKSFIENRVKGLRDGNPATRFDSIQYLIELNRIALPVLFPEVKENPNPMLVRCAVLALAEIGSPDVAPLLENVAASGSDFGRDERMIAALGLGKLDVTLDIAKLRALVEPRENSYLRRAAALALARKKDEPAAARMIKWATRQKEDELVRALVLSAFMIGGEEVIKEVPRLFRTLKNHRPVMALGAAYLADPVILPELLKYAGRDVKVRKALSVTLGRYRSPEAQALLEKIVFGDDPRAAEDALYSLTYQDESKAEDLFRKILRSGGPALRKHALLALADSALAAKFPEAFDDALEDADPGVRSAGALALRRHSKEDTPMRLTQALKREQAPEVASDLLLVLGLVGGDQQHKAAREWIGRAVEGRLARTAEAVQKVMSGKLDPRILEEMYWERLSSESGLWHYRLRDRTMDEVYKVLELDRIMRRNTAAGGSEDTGSSGGEAGGEEGSGDEGGGEGGEGGEENEGPGDDGVSGSAEDIIQPPLGTTGDGGNGQKKKFNFRWEVVERDIKNWFDHYPYFPDAFFRSGT